jgi:hypothetical protein
MKNPINIVTFKFTNNFTILSMIDNLIRTKLPQDIC